MALAVAAAQERGFDDAATEYAVAVTKVAVGRAVGPVTTAAHQLHGAIGVTIEHPLWSVTMRARSWADEFGDTASYARRWAAPRSPATRGTWSSAPESAVDDLVHAGLDVDAVTEIGEIDAEASVSASSTCAAVSNRIRSVPSAGGRRGSGHACSSGVVGDQRRCQSHHESGLRMLDTYQLPTSRSVSGRGRSEKMYSGRHVPRISASSTKPSPCSRSR